MNVKKHKVIFTILLVALLSLLSCKADIIPVVPPNSYLTFYSDKEFTVTPYKGWSGGSKSALEFSTDPNKSWTKLTAENLQQTAVKTGDKYYLYFRGTDNNTMGTDLEHLWSLTGSNVYCSGNIENLLDYKTVEKGEHPQMNEYCFSWMFSKCTSLETAPELKATTLADSCYNRMFSGCSALKQAPELPATTLVTACYANMFADCTSLAKAPELPATTLIKNCYNGMFSGCISLATAPELPATMLTGYCYSNMFYGCEKLNSVTCLATNINASYCLSNWLTDTAETGTFTKAKETTIWTVGGNVPSNWTIQEIQ